MPGRGCRSSGPSYVTNEMMGERRGQTAAWNPEVPEHWVDSEFVVDVLARAFAAFPCRAVQLLWASTDVRTWEAL